MNTLRINKVGVLSLAKMYAAIMSVISLLFSIPYGLMIIAYGLFGASFAKGGAAWAIGGGGIVVGILLMIGIPIVYGAFGVVGGAIGGLLYNVFSHFVGGIEIEVDRLT